MSQYLIIADDITGSCDTGLQLKRRGIETVVTLDAASVGLQNCSYVLDTESRSLKGDTAFALLNEMLTDVDMNAYNHVVKKVDSTLRGPIANEIAALDSVFIPDLIIFMPALPDLGRITINGVQMLHGKPITQTELANDPKTPVKEDNIQKLLEAVYNEPVRHVNTNDIEQGNFNFIDGRLFSFDATSNTHMQTVAAAAIKTGKTILWVGSAGIVDALMAIEMHQYPSIALVASLSETSRDQVLYAVEKGAGMLTLPTVDMLEFNMDKIEFWAAKAISVLENNRDVIIVSDAVFNREVLEKHNIEDASKNVQRFMGVLAADIISRINVSGVFVTGGDTAMGFLKAIEATGLQIVNEVQIGLPLSKAIGGSHNGLKVITKAGAFGEKDAIYFAMRKLKENIKNT